MEPTPPKSPSEKHLPAGSYERGEPVIYLGRFHAEVVETDAPRDLIKVGGSLVPFWIDARVVQPKRPRTSN